ncbi:MAG: hypothetical protein RLZZ272_1142 [Actinomycetota bacterium]
MREEFDRSLDDLEAAIAEMGERAEAMLEGAMRAFAARDAVAAEAVVAADADVDRLYEDVQQGVVRLIALQAPVARDLRVAASMIHASLHLERMADYACSVARAVQRVGDLDADPAVSAQLGEMAGHAREVGRAALLAFAQRDEAAAREVPRLDDLVDRMDLGIFRRLVALAAADESLLPWAAQMIGVARQIERYADHGVDIAEQVVFVVTGRTVELSSSDAGRASGTDGGDGSA